MALILNGTTVKKVIVNGTEVKEVYANNEKVFSAELVIYQNGVIDSDVGLTVHNKTTGGTYKTSDTYLTINTPYAGNVKPCTYIRTTKPIDLTDYTTLTFTGYKTEGSNHYVGFDTRSSMNWGSSPYYPSKKVTVSATSAKEYTIDVSSLSGNYYLWFVKYGSVYEGGVMKLNNIILK